MLSRRAKPQLLTLVADAATGAVSLGKHGEPSLLSAATAGYSSMARAAVQRHEPDRKHIGELPRVPSMPSRSLLMRKLVELERLLRPQEQQPQPPAPATSKQQARTARKATADAYLSAVSAAAARQDVQSLLQQLSTAAEHAPASSSGTQEQHHQQQQMPWLLPAALTVAARQLAAGPGGNPQFAQALVELVLDQGLVEPQRAQRAVHAVLQAYYDAGDYAGVLAAAARFFDVDDSISNAPADDAGVTNDSSSSSSSRWSLKPSSVTLALLLDAAAAQGDAALLLGVWKYFGANSLQQQQQPGSSLSSSSKKAAGALPPPVVLHALSHGAVMCDLAAAAQASEGASSGQGVCPVVFIPDSCTVDVLYQLQRMASRARRQQQQQDAPEHASHQEDSRQLQLSSSRRRMQQHRSQRQPLQLPLPLLHTQQASRLLQLCSSAADVDLLLLSQLYQRGGLGPQDLMLLQQRLQEASGAAGAAAAIAAAPDSSMDSLGGTDSSDVPDSSSSSSGNDGSSSSSTLGWALASQGPIPLGLLDQLPAVSATIQPPAFPPPLHADVAYAAVAAYLRTGAFGRAAAVAHAAAVQHPRDIQQFHLLVRGAAAAGAALPGLVVVRKLKDMLWQVPSPKAQAAMLRVLAKAGASPPLGAAPSPARLASFFAKFCTPHPDTWGAFLQGLVVSGDRGNRTLRTLRVAMSQPYNYLAMSGFSAESLDRARSRVVAAVLRGVLAAPEQRSRLAEVSAAAAAALQQSLPASPDSSSGNAPQDSMLPCTSGFIAGLDVNPAAVKQAAVLNATAAAPHNSSSSSGLLGGPSALTSSSSGWLPSVEQAVPGLPLQHQPVHTRLKVVLVLQILQVLRAWGVKLQHDAALAAALQVLRFCWDTEDARQSGLLVEVLRAALELGIQPSQASLKALLACCADLESRPGKTPLGLASGPGFNLDRAGYVDLGQVLQACREALQEQQGGAVQQPCLQADRSELSAGTADGAAVGGENTVSFTSSSSTCAGAGTEAQRQLAAQLLRTWVFNSTFAYVEGTRQHGPTWPLSGAAAAARTSASELSAAVGA